MFSGDGGVVRKIRKASPDGSAPLKSKRAQGESAVVLKKLTARVLEDLKNPQLAPSNVILAALIKAQTIK